jgi:hypothetical protein
VLLPAQNKKELVLTPLIVSLMTNASCSVKDLPQEVKDGLEIIHVRYVAKSAEVNQFNDITDTSGRLCAMSGRNHTGQEKKVLLALKVGSDLEMISSPSNNDLAHLLTYTPLSFLSLRLSSF